MPPLASTPRGRATSERIVPAAAQLIGDQGAAATSVDDVTAATRASKSQLYHYFGDKHGLLEAVVRHQSAVVLGFHARAPWPRQTAGSDSNAGLPRWWKPSNVRAHAAGARSERPSQRLATATNFSAAC
ncbi:MAG: TetR/AcrR family transcriptional regulator [Solirubrobacterales bacterium]|nr:TetR/AcrR family transcriptional regulator [Solirubrobacterales bacterium]